MLDASGFNVRPTRIPTPDSVDETHRFYKNPKSKVNAEGEGFKGLVTKNINKDTVFIRNEIVQYGD